ncbi:MAG: CehA/McbA family metallohydrolase [Caldilineaceae bacterium]|nr:CehA/McbA family metallohydrolase [Caldilineaceae bacterium]
MTMSASPYFQPVNLAHAYNIDQQLLTGGLEVPKGMGDLTGNQTFSGIPFDLGNAGEANAILLAEDSVAIDLDNRRATYVLFLHVVEDRITNYLPGLADFAVDGNELGDLVADYVLEYADGSTVATSILRRFAIQQSRIGWGASAAAAVPALPAIAYSSTTDDQIAHGTSAIVYGRGETRVASGRERGGDKLWIYALPNPHPDRPLRRLLCVPQKERAVIYAIATTELTDHPLRPGLRRKARLTLPEGVTRNKLGEVEGLAIDLGVVISARTVLNYDEAQWLSDAALVQPQAATNAVIVEYVAHPQAKLYVPTSGDSPMVYDLAALAADPSADDSLIAVAPAHRPVTVRVVEKASHQPVAVRFHMHGAHGEYLPPRGNHRRVNPHWFEDNYGEFVNGNQQYAYINGECVIDLPLGEVYVELSKGHEMKPVRTKVTITPETNELTFELERVLHWREQGWVTADTHVHFLSPTTALLEGQAEGVNVVNLLASQWGEMFSNVTDFDGRTTLGAKEFGGNGEFLVRVGTENRMQTLGHISLLGYSGQMIHPLCTGGPTESALGDPLEVTMAEWAQRCIDQGGLVVLPHAPNPQLERAADIVLGVVNAMEMMTFNPLNPNNMQVSPYGLADWYRYLNLGYQIPVVGGSDKMAAASLLGGIRTYAHLGDRELSYENWMAAVRAGNTFVTVGPLIEVTVEGVVPGGQVALPAGGGTVDVSWRVESATVPISAVEIVVGGLTAEAIAVTASDGHGALQASGNNRVAVDHSTWIALRVRGSYHGRPEQIAAHSSAIQLVVDGKSLFAAPDAMKVLEQIEGAIAYVDTLAPRPQAQRFKELRATLESAYNRLHQRLHQNGVFHRHTPLHDHDVPREH